MILFLASLTLTYKTHLPIRLMVVATKFAGNFLCQPPVQRWSSSFLRTWLDLINVIHRPRQRFHLQLSNFLSATHFDAMIQSTISHSQQLLGGLLVFLIQRRIRSWIKPYIHTYIHTLLARPHGAFQSQFYITSHPVPSRKQWKKLHVLARFINLETKLSTDSVGSLSRTLKLYRS